MNGTWEYEAITLKAAGGIWSLRTVNDEEVTATLNREGTQGWKLVNAIRAAPASPLQLLFKRPR